MLHTGEHAFSPRKHQRHEPGTGHSPDPPTRLLRPAPFPDPEVTSAKQPRPHTGLQLTVPHRSSGHRDPDRRQDRRPAHPDIPGQSPARAGPQGQGGPGTGQVAGTTVPAQRGGGHSMGRWPLAQPRPTRAPPCEVTSEGASFVPSARPARCGLCPRRVLPLPSPAPAPDTKGAPTPPARAPPPAAPLSRGGGHPAATKGAPAGSPEARRVLDALLELHRHGCGAALTGSRTAAPRAASSAARPARPPARPRRAPRPPAPE